MMNDVAVFIASSDNTHDILARVYPSVRRFWPDCPYDIYVGLNTEPDDVKGFKAVLAPKSQWRTELGLQLSRVPARYVLLLLDDFLLLDRVNARLVLHVADAAVRRDLDYVRLKPVERSLAARLLRGAPRVTDPAKLEEIPRTAPYFSSLQIALWKVAHLRASLTMAGDIWSFEHLVLEGSRHYALAVSSPIPYVHVVERGKWLPAAAKLFRRAGMPFDPGVRKSWPWSTQIRIHVGRIRFAIFGYTGVRLRRFTRQLFTTRQ